MTATEIFILDGGSAELTEYQAYWNIGGPQRFRIPCHSVLIKHNDGLFLFDTGFDLDHAARLAPGADWRQTSEQTLPAQLALLGIAPTDIDLAIYSHLHLDHCGGHRHLPNATAVCHERELASALTPHTFESTGYSDLSFLESSKTTTLPSDTELAPGVWALETPGHSAGHLSLLIEQNRRQSMIFTGDAVYGQKSLDLNAIPSFHQDPAAAYRSVRRLTDLAVEHDSKMIFSHDPEQYPELPKAPHALL